MARDRGDLMRVGEGVVRWMGGPQGIGSECEARGGWGIPPGNPHGRHFVAMCGMQFAGVPWGRGFSHPPPLGGNR